MLINLQVQWLALKELVTNTKNSIKDKLQLRKEKKLEDKYKTLCESFNFVINPYESPERYLVLQGNLFRVRFQEDGVHITNAHGNYVEEKLLQLQILQQIKEAQ